LQGSNGSIGHSPSATAYFALYVKPQDSAALKYLRNTINPDGGATDFVPFDMFEAAWSLWNLSLLESWDQETILLFHPHIDHLKQGWEKGKGIGLSVDYTVFPMAIIQRWLLRYSPVLDIILMLKLYYHSKKINTSVPIITKPIALQV